MSTENGLLERVQALVESVVLRSVDADAPLIDSGLVDSVLAVEIVLRVEIVFGVSVPPTEIAEHLASATALASFIAAQGSDGSKHSVSSFR